MLKVEYFILLCFPWFEKTAELCYCLGCIWGGLVAKRQGTLCTLLQPSAASAVSPAATKVLLEQGCAPWKRSACLLEVGIKNWEQVTYEL